MSLTDNSTYWEGSLTYSSVSSLTEGLLIKSSSASGSFISYYTIYFSEGSTYKEGSFTYSTYSSSIFLSEVTSTFFSST